MISLTPSKPLLLSALWLATAAFATHSQAATESFSGMYSPTKTQYYGVAVYGSTDTSNKFTSQSLTVFGSSPAVIPPASTTLGPVQVQVPTGATNLRVSVFSVYDLTNGFVTLALDSTVAANFIANGTSFGTAFSMAGTISEATFASDCHDVVVGSSTAATAASTALTTFFNTYSADFPAVSGTNTAAGTLVTFSNAAAGGTATLTLAPVPEPSTWALLGLGIVGLGVALRRRLRAPAA